MDYDKDIKDLNISDFEKNGLQVYRNYQNAFIENQIKLFVEDCDNKQYLNLEKLQRVLYLISNEESKYLPIVICSYADECFESMLKRIVPKETPGGAKSLLDGFGSLSSFSNRIQIAYVFDLISKDILIELNALRKVRNDFAHRWDIEENSDKLVNSINSRSVKIEDLLIKGNRIKENLSVEDKWKCHLIVFVGRIHYETELYYSCVKKGLNPTEVLYDLDKSPKLFKDVTVLTHSFLEKYKP